MSQVLVIALAQAITREGNPDRNSPLNEILIADTIRVPELEGFVIGLIIKET